MYLRQSNQKRADGSVLSHLQIAESVWDPVKKRSRVRIVYNCGRSDDPAAAERLRRLASSILRRCAPEELVDRDPSMRVADAWPYGDLYVLEQLWRRVGLPDLIAELAGDRKVEFSIERALFAMVAQPRLRAVFEALLPRAMACRGRADRGLRGAGGASPVSGDGLPGGAQGGA